MEKQHLIGSWKLVSSTRTILETGEVSNSYGENPNGWISYGADGRMMVVVAHDGREKPTGANIDDQLKAGLFSSFFAYGGTYDFDGNTVVHHIDVSWNESWTGTVMRRIVEIDNGRAIYKTQPFAFSGDGRMSVVTLIWEKFVPA